MRIVELTAPPFFLPLNSPRSLRDPLNPPQDFPSDAFELHCHGAPQFRNLVVAFPERIQHLLPLPKMIPPLEPFPLTIEAFIETLADAGKDA